MSDRNDNTPRPSGNAPRGSRRNQSQQPAPTSPSPAQRMRPTRGSRGQDGPPKRVSRQQKDAMYQRMLYIGLAAAAALIVLSLGVGAIYEYQIKPNQVLATVNGQDITRRDYWKYQSVTLYNQARLYENYARQFTGQEQTQFLTYASQLDAARGDVFGSTDVSDATISQMIEDRLYVQAAENQGLDLSQPVLEVNALNTYAPQDAQLVTPIPSPTMIPQRAEWATQTADAMATQQALAMGTPVGATPIAGTPTVATPVAGTAVAGTPIAGAPVAGTPIVGPIATPLGATPAATPNMQNVRTNAQAEYSLFVDTVLDDADLSEAQYLDMFVKPEVARKYIDAQITDSVPQSAPQVEVSHIMVPTKELADEVFGKINSGEMTFSAAAEQYSRDMRTVRTGGDLGWVTEGELPEELSSAAFGMSPGQMSEPIETPYGWHILKVNDKSEDRALTDTQYNLKIQEATTAFLEEQRTQNEISSDYYNPTPTPTATAFTAPQDAPTPISATPVSGPDWSATPVQGPMLPSATPGATPAGTPVGTPGASPGAETTPAG